MLALILSAIAWTTAVGPPPEPSIEVAPTTLRELVEKSDAIVVGHVDKVDERRTGWFSRKHRIADVSVKRVIKGPADLHELSYFAEPSWACDTATAIAGEDALFFLDDAHDSLDSRELYRVGHSGNGRLLLCEVGAHQFAPNWPYLIELPTNLVFVDPPEVIRKFIRTLALDELTRSIEIYLAVHDHLRCVATAAVNDDDASFTLSVSDGGACRLVFDPRAEDQKYQRRLLRELVFQVRSDIWSPLRLALDDAQKSALPERIGDPSRSDCERSIRCIAPKSDRTTTIGAIDEAWMSDAARAADARRALRLWSMIRALIDDPKLVDRREDDARWLDEKK